MEVLSATNEGAAIEEKRVGKEVGAVIFDAKKKQKKDEGEKEGSKRIYPLSAR